jgi:hypothetical protein
MAAAISNVAHSIAAVQPADAQMMAVFIRTIVNNYVNTCILITSESSEAAWSTAWAANNAADISIFNAAPQSIRDSHATFVFSDALENVHRALGLMPALCVPAVAGALYAAIRDVTEAVSARTGASSIQLAAHMCACYAGRIARGVTDGIKAVAPHQNAAKGSTGHNV